MRSPSFGRDGSGIDRLATDGVEVGEFRVDRWPGSPRPVAELPGDLRTRRSVRDGKARFGG